MSEEDSNALQWRTNLKGKSDEIRLSIRDTLGRIHRVAADSSELQRACSVLLSQVEALELMFATGRRPAVLVDIKNLCVALPRQPGNVDVIRGMLYGYDRMALVGENIPSERPMSAILAEYAKDVELNELLNRLKSELNRLLEQGEDELVGSLAKELRKILEEIESLQGKSLLDIDPILEFLITTLGTIYVSVGGSDGLKSILVSALVLSIRSRKRLFEFYENARKAWLIERGLRHARSIEINLLGIDQIENEDQATVYLNQLSRSIRILPSVKDSSTTLEGGTDPSTGSR